MKFDTICRNSKTKIRIYVTNCSVLLQQPLKIAYTVNSIEQVKVNNVYDYCYYYKFSRV